MPFNHRDTKEPCRTSSSRAQENRLPMPFSRRDFLRTSAAGCVGVLAAPAMAAAESAPLPTNPPAAFPRPKFHSRHIPIELLNLETPMGKEVVRNGLCDTIKPDNLKRLRDVGVELIEMRFVWWEIEPEPERFDWSRALRDIETVLDAGMKVGMFAWFQYPPTWYDPEHKAHARFRALATNQESTVLSLWDPKTIDVYDRLLAISAEKLKGRLSFVYNAVSGTYGEVEYSLGAEHYKFSSICPGYLLGDRCARTSFASEMEQKYKSIDALNDAWGIKATSFQDDLMPKIPFAKNSLRQRDDCMQWSTGTLLSFADHVCVLYQKHFPGIPGGLPLGFIDEPMVVGQIKSLAAKLAAKYNLTARWTGCACLGAFERSNLLARRIASAAHYYGAPFGTEAALTLDAGNAANGLYESMANGASLIHDDPQNIFRAFEVHKSLRPQMIVDRPETPIAVYYPIDENILHIDGVSWDTLVKRCAELRKLTDYDVCDGHMIADGYLTKKRYLVFPVNSHLREATAQAILQFITAGGAVWLYGDSQLPILHRAETLQQMAAQNGMPLHEEGKSDGAGFYRIANWQDAAAHIASHDFKIPDDGRPCFRTMHQRHESCYFSGQQRFELSERIGQ